MFIKLDKLPEAIRTLADTHEVDEFFATIGYEPDEEEEGTEESTEEKSEDVAA